MKTTTIIRLVYGLFLITGSLIMMFLFLSWPGIPEQDIIGMILLIMVPSLGLLAGFISLYNGLTDL